MNFVPPPARHGFAKPTAASKPQDAPRIYYVHPPALGGLEAVAGILDRVGELGFDHLLLSPGFEGLVDGEPLTTPSAPLDAEALRPLAAACRQRGLRLMLDVAAHRYGAGHPLLTDAPDCFNMGPPAREEVIDPRRPAPSRGASSARLTEPECAERVGAWVADRLRGWAEAGVEGFRLLQLDAAAPDFWAGLIAAARDVRPDLLFIGDTPGLPREVVQDLADCGFDRFISSLAWWDYRASWLVEEQEALRAAGLQLAAVEAPFGTRLARRIGDPEALERAYRRALLTAAATGAGLLVPQGFERASATPLAGDSGAADEADLSDAVRTANRLVEELSRFQGDARQLSSPGAPVTALLVSPSADARQADEGLLILINPDLHEEVEVSMSTLLSSAPAALAHFQSVNGEGPADAKLGPGEVRLLRAERAEAIVPSLPTGREPAIAAADAPRIAIEAVTPSVEGGFPAKRTVGDLVVVEADIFADGHELLAAEVRWRAMDEDAWSRAPLTPQGNDRWRGEFALERLGRHEFTIEAWLDIWGGFTRDLTKKMAANVDVSLDLREGLAMIEAARDRAKGQLKRELGAFIKSFNAAAPEDRGMLLTSAEVRVAMTDADERRFRTRLDQPLPVDAERLAARFASWYELFPRSQSDDPGRHGTFDDVIARLPAVRDMGFDVLYFPPIHPIGLRNRKGRNNSLTAQPGEPGSPYAIGSEAGGHDAIHPELGTLEDFRRLVAAAHDHGLEIALDFAIQCSPDHPWLKDHPGWFAWRPDGSMKYAENPPKKYEDIVNVDFYAKDAVPDLWIALRDVVLHWVGEGVRTFRVDNPHTKPLPFWEWMIGEVRAAHPDVIFLSEAFTRPKVMYRLAKVGFSQSYTYFTWRHTKQEFIDYLTELSTTAPKEFFRPHFFVNTPDINPYFLQTSGRPGFLIRAALAATLSGLWGVYSGFELLESDPVPGKEEFKDSEKYEIKPRDWRRPGNIIAEITQLNRIRKSHPALHSHLNVTFYPAFNDNVLYFGKQAPGADDMVLTAVSLDPHHAQETEFEIPLWEWGLADDGALEVEDLVSGTRFTWRGKIQRVRLDLDRPYGIWSVRPLKERSEWR